MAFAPFIPAIVSALATAGGAYAANKATGSKASTKQVSLQTKEQKEMAKLVEQALKDKTGPFADLLKDFDISKFEEGVSKPALQNFTENILPALQEKFVGAGYGGTPTAARELNKAGTGLSSTLANLLYQAQTAHKQNKDSNTLNLLNSHQQGGKVENVHTPGNSGLAPGILKVGGDITSKIFADAQNGATAPAKPISSQPTAAVVG